MNMDREDAVYREDTMSEEANCRIKVVYAIDSLPIKAVAPKGYNHS
jgi:hypothetical protein